VLEASLAGNSDCPSGTSLPLISVIMPCYNAAEFLRRGIESALAQSYRNIELIVIDDGSTDSTPVILRELVDPRIRSITQGNRGVCSARNAGLRVANGEFIAFLDADDTWRADCLQALLSALQRNPKAALAYCGWQNVGLTGGRGEPFVPPNYESSGKIEALIESCRWPIHAALCRRDAVALAGEFDERYPTSEDFLFWLKIGARNAICRVPEVLAFYHHHEGTRATRDRFRLVRNHWLVQREFLRSNPDIRRTLGRKRIRDVTDGRFMSSAYECYWRRDLHSAQRLFRYALAKRLGRPRDLRYLLPSVLPAAMYRYLIRIADR
jgi:glycosyltransferase involved in cell wall biosynthesis